MAIAMTMMLGRVGAVVGNLLFPVLFKWSCLGPFGMIGIACLSTFYYESRLIFLFNSNNIIIHLIIFYLFLFSLFGVGVVRSTSKVQPEKFNPHKQKVIYIILLNISY